MENPLHTFIEERKKAFDEKFVRDDGLMDKYQDNPEDPTSPFPVTTAEAIHAFLQTYTYDLLRFVEVEVEGVEVAPKADEYVAEVKATQERTMGPFDGGFDYGERTTRQAILSRLRSLTADKEQGV